MKIQFITGNKNKFEEAQKIIPGLEQLDMDLIEIQEIDAHTIIRAKLEEAKKHCRSSFVVEDTSFYMDCISDGESKINKLPGPFIKWFLQTIGNDGLYELAKKYDDFDAHIRTIVGYSDENGAVSFFEGSLHGVVVSPQGNAGFGLDPIFRPSGHSKTFSQMGQEKKNAISMRKIAFEKLDNFLK